MHKGLPLRMRNYCYLPLAIPPQEHNVFGEDKLCALGLTANTTNSTAPWPWGTLLTVEERMDHPQAGATLLMETSPGLAVHCLGGTGGQLERQEGRVRAKCC